jgi:hypothetical protein
MLAASTSAQRPTFLSTPRSTSPHGILHPASLSPHSPASPAENELGCANGALLQYLGGIGVVENASFGAVWSVPHRRITSWKSLSLS